VLGVLHYWFHKLAKNDLSEPMIYAAVLSVLLGVRVLEAVSSRTRGQGLAAGRSLQGSVDSPAKSSVTVSRRRTQ